MESSVIEYLLKDEVRHAYVIQSIRNKDTHFELKTNCESDLSYAAIWHDDCIVTLYGQATWCQKWFDHYFGRYDFYDIQPRLLKFLCEGSEHVLKADSGYEKQTHRLMELMTSFSQCQPPKSSKGYSVKAGKSSKGKVRYKYTEKSGKTIGRVLTEKVGSEYILISELLIHKPFRMKGHGAEFVKNLMNRMLSEEKDARTFILYVDQTNIPAVKLYEKLGFKEIDVFDNFVLEEDVE